MSSITRSRVVAERHLLAKFRVPLARVQADGRLVGRRHAKADAVVTRLARPTLDGREESATDALAACLRGDPHPVDGREFRMARGGAAVRHPDESPVVPDGDEGHAVGSVGAPLPRGVIVGQGVVERLPERVRVGLERSQPDGPVGLPLVRTNPADLHPRQCTGVAYGRGRDLRSAELVVEPIRDGPAALRLESARAPDAREVAGPGPLDDRPRRG